MPTRGGSVDQISQDSDVFGGRLTISTPLGADKKTKLLWGADYNQERSDMPLDLFDPKAYDRSGGLVFNRIGTLTCMPPLTTCSGGIFGQLQHKFNAQWSMEGGLRYERQRLLRRLRAAVAVEGQQPDGDQRRHGELRRQAVHPGTSPAAISGSMARTASGAVTSAAIPRWT